MGPDIVRNFFGGHFLPTTDAVYTHVREVGAHLGAMAAPENVFLKEFCKAGAEVAKVGGVSDAVEEGRDGFSNILLALRCLSSAFVAAILKEVEGVAKEDIADSVEGVHVDVRGNVEAACAFLLSNLV